jgi:phthiodiolone/phenolphthiodiolone dimycocerosates ketoreductase
MNSDVQTAVNHWPSRFAPPQAAADVAQALEASGVVDWFQTWDQLVSFLPQGLWREDVTPMARFTSDCDSYYNAAMVAMVAACATERLGITTTMDAVRQGPAEMLQQMVTLAAATEGRVSLQLGAGELKQCKPFGHKRSQALSRMDDIYAIWDKLLTTDGVVSHEGKHWAYEDAWIGSHWPKKPEFWALGGGDRLIEVATTYASGFMSMTPSAFASPDEWGSQVQEIRKRLDGKGRDPDDFMYGFWAFTLVYETDEQRQRLFDSPIVKWMTAVFGRLHHGAWADQGIDLIFPADWHYAKNMIPQAMSRDEVDAVVAKVTPEMIEKSWIIGTPAEVALQFRPWIEAGCNYIAPSDLAPAVFEPEEQKGVLNRMIELCAHLKGAPAAG